MSMYLQKVPNKQKSTVVFCWRLEGHWRKQQDPDLDPNPDPLVKGMDPRIRTGSAPKFHGSATLLEKDSLFLENWQKSP